MTAPDMALFNPFTGDVFDTVAMMPADAIEGIVHGARTAQAKWRGVSMADRCTVCEEFLRALQSIGDVLAREVTLQMGKPFTGALTEVRIAIENAKAVIAMADNALGEIWLPEENGVERAVRQEPLGVVLDLPSWNDPVLLSLRTLIPAILGGNAVIVKHSNRTPLTGRAMAAAFEASGGPFDLVQDVIGDAEATAALVTHPGVDAISYAGTADRGAAIRRQASGHCKRLVFELESNSPAFVCADADLDAAARGLARGVFENAGQSAWAVGRIYVEKDAYDAFAGRFAEHARGLAMGDPMSGATTLGPMATKNGPADLECIVQAAVEAGGRLLVGPADFDTPDTGWFSPPVVVGEAPQDCALMQQACLGPAVGLMPVDGDDQAVAWMNDSPYGLSASIWTQDADRTMGLADRLETGTVFLNETGVFDPALPWAPAKESGQGVTLSPWGLHQYTRSKALHLRTGPPAR